MEDKFKCDDRVVIRNISRRLNDKTGTIVGRIDAMGEALVFIVMLDEPVTGESGFLHRAVSLPYFALEYFN